MNKKFLIGLSAAAVATSFMACGDGEIAELTNADMAIQFTYVDADDSALFSLRDNAIKDCSGDPACSSKMGNSAFKPGNTNPDPVITDPDPVIPTPGPVNPLSSSSFMPTLTSSSSIVFNPTSSEDGEDTPPVPSGAYQLGTCAPVYATGKTAAEKDVPLTWKFTFNKSNTANWTVQYAMQNTTFTWDFGTAAATSGSASGFTSPSVTYAASGSFPASLTISDGKGITEKITCSNIQVNGEAITGCKCSAAAATADVAAGGAASWAVTGCSSKTANITSYTWKGATGTDANGSYVFTEKGQTLAPTVKVGNDDNTIVDVTCDEVKAINSDIPDYEILANQAAGKIAIPAGATSVHVKVPVSGQSCVIFCETTWTQELEGKLNMTVGGVKATGAYNVTVSLPVDQCDDDMVDFDLSAPATCGVQ